MTNKTMRWSIIRLIWLRELRDQARDRRTLFMVLVLPLLMYPVLGFAVIKFALGFSEKPSVIGISGAPGSVKDFPPRLPAHAGRSVVPEVAWMAALPDHNLLAAACLASAAHASFDYPLLIEQGQFTGLASTPAADLVMQLLAQARLRLVWLDKEDPEILKDKGVDLIVSAPADFFTRLEEAEKARTLEPPALQLLLRPDDDHSKQARTRLQPLLDAWKKRLQKVRLARTDLPPRFR